MSERGRSVLLSASEVRALRDLLAGAKVGNAIQRSLHLSTGCPGGCATEAMLDDSQALMESITRKLTLAPPPFGNDATVVES